MSSRIDVDKCSRVAPPMNSARLRRGMKKYEANIGRPGKGISLLWAVELVDAVAWVLLVRGGLGTFPGVHDPRRIRMQMCPFARMP
eukprot:4356402-Pyramimonas_sp.AAC.1